MTIDAAFTHFPMLTTDRLNLRQRQPSDAEAMFAIKSNPQVTLVYAQEPHHSLDDTRAWIQRLQDYYERREALFWCLTLKGEDTALGSCTFWNFDFDSHCAEIGYELNPAYWGQGIMSEALSTVIAYGFNQLGLNRIEACPFAGNIASKNILLKLGFTHEGTLRQRVFFRGHYLDQLYFGLLKAEWEKSR